jgi:hypothetical protein
MKKVKKVITSMEGHTLPSLKLNKQFNVPTIAGSRPRPSDDACPFREMNLINQTCLHSCCHEYSHILIVPGLDFLRLISPKVLSIL